MYFSQKEQLSFRNRTNTFRFLSRRAAVATLLMAVFISHSTNGTCQDTPTLSSELKGTSFEIYGFAQVDYIQNFRRADPNWDDTLRPSKIPTEDGVYGSDGQSSLSVKQSRFGAKADLPVEGQLLFTKFEFDLFGVGVDQGQTTFRLRHAFGEWGQILGGQTDSLFMDMDIFPNTIDYWGPAGMVFLRNPQIRWTPLREGGNKVSIAVERPSNDIDSGRIREFDPELSDAIQNDEKIPDFTAHYRRSGDWGHVQLAGIIRSIGFDTRGSVNNEPKDSKVGWGTNLTSVLKVTESDTLKLGGVVGQGIASYMNDGGTDLAPEFSGGRGSTEALMLFGVSAFLDHSWSKTFTSSVGYSRTQVDNTNLQTADAFFAGDYAAINLLYSPSSQIMFGGELLYGSREDNDGSRGDDLRTQISVKYAFSSGNIVLGKQGT